ncbi:threonylcarbamoyl-AMP synthase [Candidatus Poribacteria bacterium]|nr:threonylcarbamoyl-AMP synthase [Candidatus Poribacteria bacterium]
MKTQVDKINHKTPSPGIIYKAARIIKFGGLVAFPTDTVYGIGADVFNDEAVEKIYKVKRRTLHKPLQILVAQKSDLKNITDNWSDLLETLVSKFWPGALTIVMKAKADFPSRVRCGLDTVGVRMPDNKIALELINACEGPIAASSANISEHPDAKSAHEVLDYMDGKVDLLIDGGDTPGSTPSTVVNISISPPAVLREGGLDIEKLSDILWRAK